MLAHAARDLISKNSNAKTESSLHEQVGQQVVQLVRAVEFGSEDNLPLSQPEYLSLNSIKIPKPSNNFTRFTMSNLATVTLTY